MQHSLYRRTRQWVDATYRYWLRIASVNTFLTALMFGVALIGFGVFLGTYSHRVLVPFPASVAHYHEEAANPLNFLAEYDSIHYIHIAMHGYSDPTLPAFFPLYPLLVRALQLLVGSPLMASLLVSWACLIGALYYYLKIAKFLWSDRMTSAVQAALVFALFPTAMFLVAAYTESLFALVALAALYYCLRHAYVPAMTAAAFATATHADGLFVVLLIGSMALLEHKQSFAKVVGMMTAGCTGLMGYMVYLSFQFHEPLQFLRAEKSWGRLQGNYLHQLTGTITIFNLIIVLGLVVAILYWLRLRPSFSIYTAAFLLIPFGTGLFYDFNRYALMAFPLQLMLYERLRKSNLGLTILCSIFSVFWCYYLVQYASGYITG